MDDYCYFNSLRVAAVYGVELNFPQGLNWKIMAQRLQTFDPHSLVAMAARAIPPEVRRNIDHTVDIVECALKHGTIMVCIGEVASMTAEEYFDMEKNGVAFDIHECEQRCGFDIPTLFRMAADRILGKGHGLEFQHHHGGCGTFFDMFFLAHRPTQVETKKERKRKKRYNCGVPNGFNVADECRAIPIPHPDTLSDTKEAMEKVVKMLGLEVKGDGVPKWHLLTVAYAHC